MTDLTKTLLITTFLFVLSGREICANVQDDFPVIKGAFFGQKPPSIVPKIFAPGIVSINGRFEGAITFSPDTTEMYFTVKNDGHPSAIHYSKRVNDIWSPIKVANFTKGQFAQEMHPFTSPDGKRIYFTAVSADFSYTKTWYVDRAMGSWGKAKMLNSPLNDDKVFFANHAKNDSLYFYNISKSGTYYASNNDENFSKINRVELGMQYHHAFIAPSRDYLIVVGKHETASRNDNDLYVTFKEPDGSWANPINLGPEINTSVNEKSPSVTHDGKYLFFSRDQANEENGRANIYWISTQIIHKLKPNNK